MPAGGRCRRSSTTRCSSGSFRENWTSRNCSTIPRAHSSPDATVGRAASSDLSDVPVCVEVSRDGIPFRSRRNQFVYQICLLVDWSLGPPQTFPVLGVRSACRPLFSFCGRQGLPSARSAAAHESAIIGSAFGDLRQDRPPCVASPPP